MSVSHPRKGRPIDFEVTHTETVYAPPVRSCGDGPVPPLLRIHQGQLCAVIVKGLLSNEEIGEARNALLHSDQTWLSPNRGMPGGELRTLGEAGTPTFTAFGGPDAETYLNSVRSMDPLHKTLLGGIDLTERLSEVFGELGGGIDARPPIFGKGPQRWAPFNYRVLDSGVQIYAHHDQHYRLSLYAAMGAEYDRQEVLSWFVTLQAPDAGGALTVYGVGGDDPHLPMLPTRFVDAAALDREYHREEMALEAGDLLIFNSGRHVHRVTPVEGSRPRVTVGGFMTFTQSRDQLGFWS